MTLTKLCCADLLDKGACLGNKQGLPDYCPISLDTNRPAANTLEKVFRSSVPGYSGTIDFADWSLKSSTRTSTSTSTSLLLIYSNPPMSLPSLDRFLKFHSHLIMTTIILELPLFSLNIPPLIVHRPNT